MKRWSFHALIFIVCAYSLGPFLWQCVSSIKPAMELTRLPPIFPSAPTLKHYISVFNETLFIKIIFNSLIVAAASTFLSIIFGSLAAFALAKLNMKREKLLLVAILAVSMFPPIATVSPLYLLIRALDLRDTLTALVITYTTFTLPLSIWVLTNFFKGIPGEIYAASQMDGCSPFQSFRRIILPLSAPGLFAAAILVFIFSWNEFLFALTFTSTSASRTIPVGIALFPGVHEIPWGEIAAASVIVTMPIVALVFAFQRRIVEGLTAGAVKG